jgi:hypothetical protein
MRLGDCDGDARVTCHNRINAFRRVARVGSKCFDETHPTRELVQKSIRIRSGEPIPRIGINSWLDFGLLETPTSGLHPLRLPRGIGYGLRPP